MTPSISELIHGQLREAVLDAAAWPCALKTIDAFLDGSGVVLLSVDERLKHAPCTANIAEMMDDYFANGWHANDLREGCCPLLRRQGIVMDHEFQDMRLMERTDFYADFLAKHDRKWFAGIGANLDRDVWCLAVQRSGAKESFQPSDLPRLRAVQGCLAQVAAVARDVGRAWLDGALRALEHAGDAALVLDWDGRVIQRTRAAARILGAHVDRHGTIRLADARASLAVHELVRHARDWRSTVHGVVTRIPFAAGQKCYELTAMPLMGETALAFSRAAVLVRIEPAKVDVVAVLKARYRLTAAELRVVLGLAGGLGVAEVAAAAGTSTNTIRAQLKQVYAKTDTGSQAKLLALLRRLDIGGV